MQVKFIPIPMTVEQLGQYEKTTNDWLKERGQVKLVHTINTDQLIILFYEPDGGKAADKANKALKEGQGPPCPDCGKPLKIRNNKSSGDLFWGCQKYPDCKGTIPFSDEHFEMVYGRDGEGEAPPPEEPPPNTKLGYPGMNYPFGEPD